MELTKHNIEERMAYYGVPGMSITLINRAQVSRAEGFGVLEVGTKARVQADSTFNACSISKFLTAMLVLKLIEQGQICLDEDVNQKLIRWKIPENEFTQRKKVTLRSLLSHQSGVMDPEGSFAELAPNDKVPKMVDLLEGRTTYCTEPVQITFEPGSDFQYSDAGFCIIQQLIEDVTGKSFDTVINELIFQPLHMNKSTFPHTLLETKSGEISCGHDKGGKVVAGKYPIYPYQAASGLWTTPSDLAKLVIELIQSLKGKSTIGLSASLISELIASQGCKEWTGLGVFLDGANQKIEISSLGWGVGFQCMLVAYPYLETGAIMMTNADLGVHQLKGIIGEVYKSLPF